MDEERSHWVRWHEQYDDPGSSVSRRLEVVKRGLAAALDAAPPGRVRVVSFCAGDGRDVIDVLATHPRRRDVVARLVELDPALAARARARAAGAGLDQVEIVEVDASSTSAYEGAVPAEVVMVCGVFGNVSDDDIRRTVFELPHLCAGGATVIWTRHRRPPDLTGEIRGWLAEAGLEESEFESGGEGSFAVGIARLVGEPQPFVGGRRMFSFVVNGSGAR